MSARQPGQILVHRFRLLHRLDQDSAGEVWDAERIDASGERVAIKVVACSVSGALENRARELGFLLQLRHERPVRVSDFLVLDAGTTAALVSDLVSGGDLRAHIADRGPCTPREAASLGLQRCAALRVLPQVPIIHRDIKPDPIL